MRNKLFLFVFLFAVLAIVDSHAFERKKYNFNSEWRLQIGDFPEAKQSQFDDSNTAQLSVIVEHIASLYRMPLMKMKPSKCPSNS